MAGLDQMITVRGGLLGLETNKRLQAGVQLSAAIITFLNSILIPLLLETEILIQLRSLDLSRAYIPVGAPRYWLYDKSVLLSGCVGANPAARSVLPARAAEMQEVQDGCIYNLKLIDNLEKMTANSAVAVDPSLEDWQSQEPVLCSAARRLFWHSSTEHPLESQMIPKWNSIRLAALLYINIALHELYSFPAQRGLFVKRFCSQVLDISVNWGRAVEMLIKLLLRDDRCFIRRHKRAWYVANAMIVVQGFGLGSWTTVEEAVRSYLTSGVYEECLGEKGSVASAIFRSIINTCLRDYEADSFGIP